MVVEARGVRLGWQWRTILIWWVPGIAFIALAMIQFHSWAVTIGLALFCAALFAFYASDREVRPRAGLKRYVLTDRRLLIGSPAGAWREIGLSDIRATRMESGPADRLVARLSHAATIVLELNAPGPKGEPRRSRIGPLRQPEAFRTAIDLQVAAGDRAGPAGEGGA
jgi:hypothetical protein